jgi:hypothetical protein
VVKRKGVTSIRGGGRATLPEDYRRARGDHENYAQDRQDIDGRRVGDVNDETNKKKPEIDFADYRDEELQELIADIERELEDRKERQKRDALEKMKEIADKVGMTPEELLGFGGVRKKKRRGRRAKKKG